MCQRSKHHVCSGHVPVLLFAAHCICFRSGVLIIPEPARVAALLTHARAENEPAELHLSMSLRAEQAVAQPHPRSTQTHCMST